MTAAFSPLLSPTDAPAPRVLVEFVSANPYGPLTLAHARGGAVGDSIARLLTHTGCRVDREFYVNDSTNERQTRVFARSVLARYRQRFGVDDPLAAVDSLPGEYIGDIAHAVADQEGERFLHLSPREAVAAMEPVAVDAMRRAQESTLAAFGVHFDLWFRESRLHQEGVVDNVLRDLLSSGHTREGSDGSLWLRTTHFGDEYDRTLRRTGGAPTYLAGDLAYHQDKFSRGYDLLIDVWDHDHSGYVARTRAGLSALGRSASALDFVVCDAVRYLKEGVEVKGNRRFGSIVTLDEVLETVGRAAARFFLVYTPCREPLDFDLDLIRLTTDANPLHRIYRARERCTLLINGTEAVNVHQDDAASPDAGNALSAMLSGFSETVREAARTMEPHRVAREAATLAAAWLTYENAVTAPSPALGAKTAATLTGALTLLGVEG